MAINPHCPECYYRFNCVIAGSDEIVVSAPLPGGDEIVVNMLSYKTFKMVREKNLPCIQMREPYTDKEIARIRDMGEDCCINEGFREAVEWAVNNV